MLFSDEMETSVRWQHAQIICLKIIWRLIAALRKKVVGIRPLLGDYFPPHAPPMLFFLIGSMFPNSSTHNVLSGTSTQH